MGPQGQELLLYAKLRQIKGKPRKALLAKQISHSLKEIDSAFFKPH